jgi:hypothetical protein
MTGKDLFGTLVRWTGLIFMLYSLFAFTVVQWFMALVMIAIGGALLIFAEDVVEWSYRKRSVESTPPPQ